MWVSEQGNREHTYPTIRKRLSPEAFMAVRDALINRDHQAAYQYLEETYECKRPVDQIDLSKSAELTIISSLLADIPGPFHAWSREWQPSKQMSPRLEAVFHNDRKDPSWKLRWTIPDRQRCAEEPRPATSFVRRECMPAIFWPVNPFPHKVDEFQIMDCLREALSSISIDHAYDLACETISEAAQQRWIE